MAFIYYVILFISLICYSCSNIPTPLSPNDEKSIVDLNISFSQLSCLRKTTAITVQDTTATLDTVLFVLTNGSQTIKDTISVKSSVNNGITLPTKTYILPILKTWKLKIYGYDDLDTLLYFDSTTFVVLPTSTTITKNVQSRFAMIIARFVSTKSNITSIKKIGLTVNSKEVKTYTFSQNKTVFDERLAFKYVRTDVSSAIVLNAYKNLTTVKYTATFNVIPRSGFDTTITVSLK